MSLDRLTTQVLPSDMEANQDLATLHMTHKQSSRSPNKQLTYNITVCMKWNFNPQRIMGFPTDIGMSGTKSQSNEGGKTNSKEDATIKQNHT